MKKRTILNATILLALLAAPLQLAAQQTRYKLIDLGTFGGPSSYISVPLNYARVLNNRGVLTGWADTSTSDPYPNFCFNPDCFVSHAFRSRDGATADLGVLPGGASSGSSWISSNGLIAGWSENGQLDPQFFDAPVAHGVLWKNGGIVDLGTLNGGLESVALAVNSRGQVVGAADNGISDAESIYSNFGFATQTRAFLWQKGEMQDLGTLGGTDAVALLINERGQIVGDSYTADAKPSDYCANNLGFALTTGAFIWENGRMEDLGNFGGTCTIAIALNDRSQVIGLSTLPRDQAQHPFLWDRGSMKDLGTFGGTLGSANALNDAGTVVGWATYPGDQLYHAALWTNGEMTDLGALEGGFSFGYDINAQEQVVGLATDSNLNNHRAVFWEKGGPIVDLNTLIPANSSLQLQEADNINDRGEIAGRGVPAGCDNSDVCGHVFLLIPCPTDDVICTDDATANESGIGVTPSVAMQGSSGESQRSPTREPLQRRLRIGRPIGTLPKTGLHDAAAISRPNATLSPTSLYFRCRYVINAGCQCITQGTTTLSNLGSATLDIKSISTTGAFTQTNNCGATLAAGNSCSISVHWSLVNSSGDVYVSDNAPHSPQKVYLSGYKECTP